ncbi:MAG: zinc/manganese transport system permease protein [Actinomycetota bacterium]|nr:zinc/manganese transport system permease protein [Actinomycetota bacterium]
MPLTEMLLGGTTVRLTWNVVADVRNELAFHFMLNAMRAGTIVAIVAAAVGWFMVLRKETFAGHTLSVVGFPGGAGAVWLGLSAMWGYFAFCIGAAVVIAMIPRAGDRGYVEESGAIGTLQAFALACGFLFAGLAGGFANGFSALLFGSFTGVTDTQVLTLLLVAVAVVLVGAVTARPLLFASIDPDVASARGVPVRMLSIGFLVVLGIAVAEASQITGSLLVFALLVVPAATAQTLTARPVLGLCVSIAVALAITWLGLTAGFYSNYPIGFWITTIAFAGYVAVRSSRRLVGRRFSARRHGGPMP